jgi:acetyl-CoA/propionyl-CoA carboxylase biotin carboxyl carrier protein
MFSRVLIANRGEIAVRVERTLRRLGIESVAVYSDADAGAPHVRAADRAEWIGATPAAQSYLDVEKVIAAAERAGAEAIHPGYGFLSESPELAHACAAAGIVFVGPGPEAMALLGDKVAAKDAAAAAGVPILPGLSGESLTDEEITAWAAGAELPIVLKAAAGGGGKGMRVVSDLVGLPDALVATRREAQGAFGDDRLLAERYLANGARHIEVQVLADSHGNAVHLGERECSLQRRHQKVVEESPSPVVDAELRERMGAAAVALLQSCGYVSAGTVELIAEREDPSAFFFLEVNTRLQVEHPVTEAVTGLDLVELQLRIAAGEELGFGQDEVRMEGHAVEARLYAEDAAHGFLPSTGRVASYREPAGAVGGPGGGEAIRVDSGIEQGSEVGLDYDPMLAKLIAHGPDRRAALAGLRAGLADLVVLGPATNAAYLRALLAWPEVREGAIDTGLIERLGAEVSPPPAAPVLAAVAFSVLLGPPPSDDPWDARDGWRASGPAWARARLAGPEGEVEVAIRAAPAAPPRERSHFCPDTDEKCEREDWDWEIGEDSGTFSFDGQTLAVDGEARELSIYGDGDAVWLLDGAAEPARFEVVEAVGPEGGVAGGGSLEAPMPGVVIDVRAEAGGEVAEGDVLVVLESMKMELSIQSPRDGVVAEVLVAVGEQIARGQNLIALAEPSTEEGTG